ncbi:MAG: methyltransferase domain-containing protein, partial [Pseudomonadota bacterium]
MRQSAATLNAFYASRLGRAAARQVNQRLMDLWGPCSGQTILGVGYTQTVLPLWETQAARCVGAIPEGIGASRLDGARGQVMCLTPEHRLPFHDQQFTRIVLLHALEEADQPRSLLREAWRVLAPEGRIVVAVANRKSFWSVTEAQAFGHGRPWTRRQLIAFLNDSLFQVTASTTAVHMPPINWRLITAAANA